VNLAVEQSLASWLQNLPAFDGIAIHTGQSNAEIPGDAPSIIAACESCEIVAGALYRATAAILLSTPSTLDLDQHRQLTTALRTALKSLSGLSPFFTEAALAGVVLTSLTESQSSDRWLCTANLTLGLAEI